MTITAYRAVIAILLIAVVALTVALMTRHTAPAAASTTSVSTTVSNYNDGFATSKQDDCEQGFAAACAWLKSD